MPLIVIPPITLTPPNLVAITAATMISLIRSDTNLPPGGLESLPAPMAPAGTGYSFSFIDGVNQPKFYDYVWQLTFDNGQSIELPGTLPGCRCP